QELDQLKEQLVSYESELADAQAEDAMLANDNSRKAVEDAQNKLYQKQDEVRLSEEILDKLKSKLIREEDDAEGRQKMVHGSNALDAYNRLP
uniref:Tropomyosin n=1 Tax=Steinernema glaseri TaxID=37863 RepID=A0A1I7ZJ78_9BILA